MDRRKILFGFGLVVIVLAMIGPPWYIWAPLMACGLFLMAWGHAPSETEERVLSLPNGARIWQGLLRLEAVLFADVRKREDVRLRLTEFLKQGQALVAKFEEQQQDPAPETEMIEWYEKLSAYLENTDGLGRSYVARLNNQTGLYTKPLAMGSVQQAGFHRSLSFRLMRLEEFLEELAKS